MKFIFMIFFGLGLVNDTSLPNSRFFNTSQPEEISPDSVKISSIKGRLVTFTDGSMLMMDGLYFPDHIDQGSVTTAWQQFAAKHLTGRLLTLDSRPFDQMGAGTNRYGDHHGKLLTADGLWVQKFLVKEGVALWSGSAVYPPDLAHEMREAEREAEKNSEGLWARFQVHDAVNPRMSAPKGRFIIAEGRVQEVYVTPKNTYLNFGEDWKTDFTAAIPSRSRSKFESKDWKLTALENKMVRIRGWIRFYNGPFVELSFPQ